MNKSTSTFSENLGRALLLSLPGAIRGMGEGIAASDPRRPYAGMGAGISAGIAPAMSMAGMAMEQQARESAYKRETDQMIERQKKLTRAEREIQAEESEYNRSRFKAFRDRIDAAKKEANIDIGKLGDFNFDDKMFLARLGAASAGPQLGAVQSSRSIMGGMA